LTLVFDIETTGKADFDRPPEDPIQPRLVQLGAILYDATWEVRAEVNLIQKPDGYDIPVKASNIHHITTEIATKYGVSGKAIMHLFAALCNRAHVIVAHNIAFDAIVIGREMSVHQVDSKSPKNKICTMNAMTNICQIKGWKPGQYKWPKLVEAFAHTHPNETFDAHDAMNDVRVCCRIYRWLIENNLLPADNVI